jgi:tetratricopeptide (TPR) repeat protein
MRQGIYMSEFRLNIWMIIAGGIFIVVTSLVAYIPAMHGRYIWDDDYYVEVNSLLNSPHGLWDIWAGKNIPSQYVPLVYTTLRFEYSLWGLKPLGYHLTNLALHVFNALLIWLLLSRLKIRGAWLVSAIFALHPVHVESVAWITELKNVLSLFFVLLSAAAYFQYVFGSGKETTGGKPWMYYLLSTFLFLCALASKAVVCFFPVLLLIILWWKNGRIILKNIRDLSLFFVLGLAFGLFVMWWEHNYIGTGAVELGLNPLKRILIASHALWFYIGKLLYPVNLMFSYPKWHIEPTNPLHYIWLFLCLVAFWGIWRWRKKLGRGFIAAIAFFITALSPMLGFFSLYTFIYTYVADHYQYVASIGIIVLVVNTGYIAVNRLGRYAKGISIVTVLLILSTLGMLTWRQCYIYKDQEALWLDTIHKNPDSLMAHINLGTFYGQKGRFDEAIRENNKALQIMPDCAKAYNNLGMVFERKGNLDKAIDYYQHALLIMPENVSAHNNLGNAFQSKGDFKQAMHHYTEAIRIRPGYAVSHYNLGVLLAKRNLLNEAIKEYTKALNINPNLVQAKTALVEAQSKMQLSGVGTETK